MNVGDVWRGWKLSKKIGEGGSGKVYYAQNIYDRDESSCAIKIVSIPKNPDDIKSMLAEGRTIQSIRNYYKSSVDSLKREINTMKQLSDCKNIVKIYDSEVLNHEDGIGWDVIIRMEYLTPLVDYINIDRKRFNVETKLRLAVDICTALEECHKRSIIHRDIKPANIFVDRNNNFKLGDFGIARNIEKTMNNMTRIGTINYIAPEVYNGKAYGKDVDIYSLGIVLYKYFNRNRLPLVDLNREISLEDEAKAVNKRLNGVAFSSPCQADNAVAGIIMKAVSYDRSKRYDSATRMKNDILFLLNSYETEKKVTEPDSPEKGDIIINKGPHKKTDMPPNSSKEPFKKNGGITQQPPVLNGTQKKDNAGIIMIALFIVLLIIIALVVTAYVFDNVLNRSIEYYYYDDPIYYMSFLKSFISIV